MAPRDAHTGAGQSRRCGKCQPTETRPCSAKLSAGRARAMLSNAGLSDTLKKDLELMAVRASRLAFLPVESQCEVPEVGFYGPE
jgi:hypothetical protein